MVNPYVNYYPQPMPQPQNYAQNSQPGIIWVQGEAGAKSYLVAPNSSVQLWDSEAHTIYIKSADASGMPSIKILDYTIRGDNAQNVIERSQTGPYVTREEFHSLKEEVANLGKEMRQRGIDNE